MKKTALLFLMLAILPASLLFSQKNIKGLENAEKAFAAFTVSHGIKEGFLQFMDSSGIIFQGGKPTRAIAFYSQQKPVTTILNWEPAFAAISASGDFGITTGPYTLVLHDKITAAGIFSSVWKINKRGEWKNIVDLGITCKTKPAAVTEVQELILPGGTSTVHTSFDEVMALDKKFNALLKEKNGAELLQYIPVDSWLNMEGEQPVTGDKLVWNVLMHIPSSVLFESAAGNISAAGDMAYVYGTVSIGTKKENYLRAWIKRNNKWRVIMQTIKW
jgi:ketosteroid isomerase-like protein